MTFLISLALAALLVRFCAKSLKAHPIPYYLGATALAAAVVLCTVHGVRFPGWFNTWVWLIFSHGALSTALFVLVMWTGALPNGSGLIKTLMPIRGELSILASILTLGHNLSFGRTYFRLLFTQPGRLPANQVCAAVCSLTMLCIMLPLFITSFKKVRRKMKPGNWKKLQRLAYGFYTLLYVHVMLLMLPYALKGKGAYLLNVLVYSCVFLSYALCRVLKHRAVKNRDASRLVLGQKKAAAGAIAVSLCLTLVLTACGGGAQEPTASEAPEEQTVQAVQDTTPAPADDRTVTDAAPAPDAEPAPETETPEQPTPTPAQETAAPAQPEEIPAPTPEATPTPTQEPVRVYQNGTFSGFGEGFSGPITVSVTIQDDVITGISVVSSSDDDAFLSEAKGVISRMLSAQSANVDTVSGATYSSQGIIAGLEDRMIWLDAAVDFTVEVIR